MINQLREVYIKWCNDYNIPNVSADEQDRDKLTYEQKSWLDDFIEQWDNQQEIDRFIYINLKHSTRNKRRGNNENIRNNNIIKNISKSIF